MTRTHTEPTLHFGKCLFCGSLLGRRHIKVADRYGRLMGKVHPKREPGGTCDRPAKAPMTHVVAPETPIAGREPTRP